MFQQVLRRCRAWRDGRRKDAHTAIRIYLANHGPARLPAIANAVHMPVWRCTARLDELEDAGKVESYWSGYVYGNNLRRRLYDIAQTKEAGQ